MTKELRYKLAFSQYEWYIWMLFLIYRYKGNDLRALMLQFTMD